MNNSDLFDDLDTNPETCMLVNRKNIIIYVYDGIPETLVFNLIGATLLVTLFTILRKKAWNYGRLALMQSSAQWTKLFYGAVEDTNVTNEQTADTASMDSLLKLDQGCCSWIYAAFKIRDDKIESRCGPDAIHYLSFQKHLIVLSAIFTVVSITIVLPINFQGQLEGNKTSFGHTTISNLDSNSPFLWVHVSLAFAYVPIALYVMSKCTGRIPVVEKLSKTLMVTNIAQAHRNQSDIFHYLRLLYKDIVFKNVELAYNVAKLTRLVEEHERVYTAKMQAEAHFKKTGERLRVQPKGCYACFTCYTEDAIDYYTEMETKLISEVDQERSRALSQPLGIAFVTVSSTESAEYIVRRFKPGTSRNWSISYAPAPSDIFWENLGVDSKFWYLKAIGINVVLTFVLFFLTTPAYVVKIIDTYHVISNTNIESISPILTEFLPTLLLLTMSTLMPVAVAYSDEFLSYWTRSKQNNSIMKKVFFFLLFMILILPSLGLTSASAFVEWSLEHQNQTYRWKCVFLPDKGAFFVNYIITAAMIGTSLELLRFPELVMYTWNMCTAKSSVESSAIQKSILIEFPFGVHYAWTLLIFTMMTVYSLVCPLITPFGLLYLCLKHFVDRYNLYFAYGPSNMSGIGGNIHASAVNLVKVSMMILLATMAGFLTVRGGGMDALAIAMIIGLICAWGCLFFINVRQCRFLQRPVYDDNSESDPDPDYIAPVLQPHNLFEAREPIDLPTGASTLDYGTVESATLGLVNNMTL